MRYGYSEAHKLATLFDTTIRTKSSIKRRSMIAADIIYPIFDPQICSKNLKFDCQNIDKERLEQGFKSVMVLHNKGN